jgi:hypothetical protein
LIEAPALLARPIDPAGARASLRERHLGVGLFLLDLFALFHAIEVSFGGVDGQGLDDGLLLFKLHAPAGFSVILPFHHQCRQLAARRVRFHSRQSIVC